MATPAANGGGPSTSPPPLPSTASPSFLAGVSDFVARGFGLSSALGRWHIISPPFGPLNGLHQAALKAQSFEWTARVVALYALIPLTPVYIQAWLLLGKQSRGVRAARIALGGAAVAGVLRAWLSFRFTTQHFNAFNNGFTICYLHLMLKAIEFALLHNPVVDPWMARGRPRWRAAFDLCCNSRMLCLGSVGIDDMAGPPNSTVEKPVIASYLRHLVPIDSELRPPTHTARRARMARRRSSLASFNEAVEASISRSASPPSNDMDTSAKSHSVNSQRPTPSPLSGERSDRPRPKPAYIPGPVWRFWSHRPTSRLGALARHVLHAATHYAVLDTFLVFLRRMALDLGAGGQGILESYSLESSFVALPELFGGRLAFNVPPGLLAVCIQASVPIVIWQGLNLGYHCFAVGFLLAGWEVQSWDVDLFDAPWRADSLIDLWGRRWHQMFRHHFILAAASTLRLLSLPNVPGLLFPFVFVFSGLLHVLGQLNMNPVPSPLALWAFFLLSGFGCALEVMFKAFTGRRVRGISGRIWCWTYTFVIGRLAADAWLDAGIAGSTLLPQGGVGEYIAPLIVGTLFEKVE